MRLLTLNILLYSLVIYLTSCNNSSISKFKKEKKTNTKEDRILTGKNIIKMEKKDGVYQIPIFINGVQMYFIFDTGASLISISNVEVTFLYKQGKLSDEDIIGSANFIDANGDISEGTIINLKEVKIGNKILRNIRASVVDNSKAPLLFGQSALENFGVISIDYKNEILIFQ
jgi:aspartyl protease family protein